MKKLFSSLFIFVLSVCVFAGCSCTPTILNSFSPYWNSGKAYSSDFKEVAVYDVKQVTNFNEVIQKEDKVTYTYDFTANENDFFSVEYSNGVYTVTSEAISSNHEKAKISSEQSQYYRITSELKIHVKYTSKTSNTVVYEADENITSQVYFLSESANLSPTYSKKTYLSTTFRGDIVYVYNYQTEIVWEEKKVNYSIVDLFENKVSENQNVLYSKVKNNSLSQKYTKGATLDNEQLLFALRGIKLSDAYQGQFKVYDTAYASLQSISVKGLTTANITTPWSFEINGEQVRTTETTDPTSTIMISYINANSTYSGTAKLCYYQSINYDNQGANEKGCIVKMVDKLTNSLGALEYTIKSVQLTHN